MAFTKDQLALTDDRKAQLEAALAGTGFADPLAQLIAEATATVARLTTGYVIAEAQQFAWIRTIVLYKAFVPAEGGVPEDIKDDYNDTMTELRAIAAGERPNLEREETDPPTGQGAWGSQERIC